MYEQQKVSTDGIEPIEVNGVSIRVTEITYRECRVECGRNKTRLYVHVEGENMLENWAYRTSRPYDTYRRVLPQVLKALGIPNAKANWNKHAGCSMCPCSPGFIISGDTEYEEKHWVNRNIWVTITADDDSAVKAEDNPEEIQHRLDALADNGIKL